MENLIDKFSMMNNNQGRRDMVNIRNDMEQTLYRYDNLMKGKKIEPFQSDFNGNNKRYEFNPKTFYSVSHYTRYNSFDHESKFESTMNKFKLEYLKLESLLRKKLLMNMILLKKKLLVKI